MQVIAEITWMCPAKCPQCPVRKHDSTKTMGLGVFGAVLDFFSGIAESIDGVKAVVLSGGEPTILPSFEEYVRIAKEKGFSVTVVTNGFGVSNILKSNADVVELSIDYYGEEHDYARGLSLWDKAGKILREFKGEVVIRSTLFQDNYKHILMIRDWANSIRKGTQILVMPVRGGEPVPKHLVEKMRKERGVSVSDNCPAGISSFVVTPELEVLACIFYRKILGRLLSFNKEEAEAILEMGSRLPRFVCELR